jgi:hypothetical protein
MVREDFQLEGKQRLGRFIRWWKLARKSVVDSQLLHSVRFHGPFTAGFFGVRKRPAPAFDGDYATAGSHQARDIQARQSRPRENSPKRPGIFSRLFSDFPGIFAPEGW